MIMNKNTYKGIPDININNLQQINRAWLYPSNQMQARNDKLEDNGLRIINC